MQFCPERIVVNCETLKKKKKKTLNRAYINGEKPFVSLICSNIYPHCSGINYNSG